MKQFEFRSNDSNRDLQITAPSYEVAVRMFNTEVLFPERYVDDKSIIRKEYLDSSRMYQLDSLSYHYQFKKYPKIKVYEIISTGRNERNQYTDCKPISLNQCINYTYENISMSNQNKLLASSTTDNAIQKVEPQKLVIVGDTSKLAKLSKHELRGITTKIDKMMLDIEVRKQELQETVSAMYTELAKKKEMIYIFETYLGVNEEVHTLIEGENATEDEPLTLYQQLLYMDEEVGIWEDGGLDFDSIDKFDEWIVTNYDKFLFKPKSICIFRIRRGSKHYSSDRLKNAILNESNFRTYFLIRNGENLYRIWSNAYIQQRLFPKTDEYDELIQESDNERSLNGRLEAKHKDYFIGLLYIQGLLDRTTILGTRLSNSIDLLRNRFKETDIILIRDDEQNKWIGDGKLSWKDYLLKNAETIKVGSRVAVLNLDTGGNSESRKLAPWIESVNFKDIHHISSVSFNRWEGSTEYRVLYMPSDDVYKGGYESVKRQRKTHYNFYKGEIINVDEITSEECEYYLHNRNERHHYLRLIPFLIRTKLFKQKEERLESEFIKLIKVKTEKSDQQISKAINWWKMKVKFKRGLMVDDAKAVRMIIKKLTN